MTNIKSKLTGGLNSIPRKRTYFFALCFITLASFGNNYAFNNPQALHESIKETLDITESQFQLFYSIFAFPNILSALFIGYLIDFFEIYKGFVILVFAVAFFQGVVAVGAYMENYYIMLAGRLFFGISSQSLITAQAALVSSLFKRKNLALALGVVITFPQIGNALNSLLTSRFYELFDKRMGGAFFMSVIFCTICSLFAIFAVRFIKVINKAEQQSEQQQLQNSLEVEEILSRSSTSSTNSQADGDAHKQTIKLKDLKELKYSFWILTLICTINLGMYIPFLDGANGLLQTRFKFSEEDAGEIIMVTYFSAAILSIPSGLLIDKIGLRRYVSIFGSILLLAVQLILYYSNEQTHVAYIVLAFSCLGLGLAIYANCVLSSVSLIVKKKILGSAFGIIQMLESVALCFFPLISGALVDEGNQSAQGYLDAEFFFIGVGVFGVFCSLGLFIFPRQQKRKLDQGKKKGRSQRDKKIFGSIQFGTFSSNLDEDSLSKSLISTKSSVSEKKTVQDLMNLYLPQSK